MNNLKAIRISHNNKKFVILIKKFDSDSNYNVSLQVRRVGEKTPIWGTTAKETDNYKELALTVIKTWEKK